MKNKEKNLLLKWLKLEKRCKKKDKIRIDKEVRKNNKKKKNQCNKIEKNNFKSYKNEGHKFLKEVHKNRFIEKNINNSYKNKIEYSNLNLDKKYFPIN